MVTNYSMAALAVFESYLKPQRIDISRPPFPSSTTMPPHKRPGWRKTPGTAAIRLELRSPIRPTASGENRAESINGRDAIVSFHERKWSRELDCRLIKEVWAHAVRFVHEYHHNSGHWLRACGNENWQFATDGLMERRTACIHEHPITEVERKSRWDLGRRPDRHPALSEIEL